MPGPDAEVVAPQAVVGDRDPPRVVVLAVRRRDDGRDAEAVVERRREARPLRRLRERGLAAVGQALVDVPGRRDRDREHERDRELAPAPADEQREQRRRRPA